MEEADELKSINTLLEEQLEALRKNTDEMRAGLDSTKQLNEQFKLSSEQIKKINLLNRQIVAVNRDLLTDEKARNQLLRDKKDISKDIQKSLKLESLLNLEINEIKQKQIGASNDEFKLLQNIVDGLESQLSFTDDINDSLKTELDLTDRVQKSLGLSGAAAESIKKSLGKMGLGKLTDQLGIDDAIKDTREFAANMVATQRNAGQTGKSFMNNIKSAKVLGKNLFKNLTKSLGPFAILMGVVDSLLTMDGASEDIAKSLGTSYKEAVLINKEMNATARNADNIFVTSEGINEAFMSLNDALGTNGDISDELLVTYTELTKQAGFTVEAVQTLSKLSLATGKNAKDLTKQYLGQAKALNLQNKTSINERSLLEDISNVSKSILVTFSDQPKELAKAAFEAKKIGLNLKAVEGIAESLLDIESSINDEFEAEVLTGRALNLERARYYALTNDIAGLSKEINNQGITAAKFAGMNRIQQDAIAKSLGMSKDEMGAMLIEQQALQAVGARNTDELQKQYEAVRGTAAEQEFLNKLGDEQYASQLDSNSAQSRFQATLTKLQDIFVQIAEPLMPILDLFGQIFEIIGPIAKLVGKVLTPPLELIGTIVQAIVDTFTGLANVIKGVGSFFSGDGFDKGFGEGFNFDSTIARGKSAIDSADYGIGKAITGKSNSERMGEFMNDGTISNKGIIVKTPKGGIQLNNKDSFVGNKNGIVAGTNLGGGDTGISAISNSLNSKLDSLIGEIRNLRGDVQKGMVVNLDGDRVSQKLMTPLAMNIRNV